MPNAADRPTLPRSVRAFLRTVIPRDARDHVLADFEELWERDQVHGTPRQRLIRTWRAALGFAYHFGVDRLRAGGIGPESETAPTSADLPGRIELKLVSRAMARTPLLTATAVLSLTIGITVAATAFGIVRGVMFSTLPVPDASQVVQLRDIDVEHGWDEYADHAGFVSRRGALRASIDLAAYSGSNLLVEAPSGSGRVASAAAVSVNTFDLLRVSASSGRYFSARDEADGALDVVVLGGSLAQSLFGSAESAIGRDVRVEGRTRTVIGIAPEGFRFPYSSELWTPVGIDTPSPVAGRVFRLFGRLSPGVTLEGATAAFALVGTREAAANTAAPARSHVVQEFTSFTGDPQLAAGLWLAVASLVLILLVSAGSVANLLLARSAMRAFEFAVRAALGAGRLRIISQLVLEAAAIAGLAAALSMSAVQWLLGRFQTTVTDLPFWIDLELDVTVMVFTAALATLATAMASAVPARHVVRFSLTDTLKGRTQVRLGRFGAVLIALQLAVAIGFLGGAAAAARALMQFGFGDGRLDGKQTLVAQLYFGQPAALLRADAPTDPERRREIWRAFEDSSLRAAEALAAQLTRLPGLESAGLGSVFPGNESSESVIELDAGPGGGVHRTRIVEAGRAYFESLGREVMRGRDFTSIELARGAAIAIVNETFVRRLRLGEVVGRRLRKVVVDTSGADVRTPWIEIVGVAPDLGLNPGDAARGDGVYLPLAPTNVLRLAIRSRGAAESVMPVLYAHAQVLSPRPQIQWSKTLDAQMQEPVIAFRTAGALLLTLGGIALLLSGAGLYALLTLRVAQSRREIAVRLALGAGRMAIARAVLGSNLRHVLAGLAMGAPLALAITAALGATPSASS